MSRLSRDREEQSGAVAVLVGLMALMLMIVAALSVDLGNAWARGRVVQKQADVAALAAGSLLPMSPTKTGHHAADIAALAANYLNSNLSQGQSTTTGSNLLDNNYANGEIKFYNEDGSTCTTGCIRLTLTPPGAYVTFGLAGTVKNGVNVVRSATVKVVSLPPPLAKVVPLWLPSGCGYGPVDGDTSGGSSKPAATTTTTTLAPSTSTTSTSTSTSTATSSTSTATPTATATVIAINPVGTHHLSGTNTSVAYGQSLTIHGWQITNLDANISKASIRLISPDGTRYIEYAASTTVPKGTMSIPDFAISTEVTNTPGVWKAYAMAQPSGTNKPIEYSDTSVTVTVTGSAPTTATTSTSSAPTSASTSASATASDTSVPVGCVGQDRGNFGQLDSPRAGGGTHQVVLGTNMAIGLDHRLSVYSGTLLPTQKECADANGKNMINTTIVQLDSVSRNGNNCIISDTGNDGPAFFDGLIGGVAGNHPGRLDVANGHTSPLCTAKGRPDLLVKGKTINNDALSCFLKGTATLNDIASSTATSSMLDQSIINSPRLVYMPVVLATDRAQKGYQPIISYVAAFITDEDYNTPASNDNGVFVNGNSVSAIRVFVFNRATIVGDPNAPDQEYDPDSGPPTVRLIG